MGYYTDVHMCINCIPNDKTLSDNDRENILSLIKGETPNNIQLAIKLMGGDCNCTKAIKLIIENVSKDVSEIDFYDDYLYLSYESIKIHYWEIFPEIKDLLLKGSDQDYAIITLGEEYDDELVLGSPYLFGLRLNKYVTHYE